MLITESVEEMLVLGENINHRGLMITARHIFPCFLPLPVNFLFF
jgi:hypothetical protein